MDDCIMRPGGTDLTRRAATLSGLKKGDKLLDIGCGCGDTAAFLSEAFGFSVTAIDIDEKNIIEACRRFPNIAFDVGDGSMLDFKSRTFDGVSMECCLSLIPNTAEAVHEAWCVLKNGGKLIISDLYWKEPTADHQSAISNAKSENQKPRSHGECQSQELVSDCVVDGGFVLDELYHLLRELHMDIRHFEDRSDDLAVYAAEILFAHGSFEKYAKAYPNVLCPNANCLADLRNKDKKSNLGYFLLIAEKKEV